MRIITPKLARQLIEVLDELRGELFQKENTSYPFSEWERKRGLVKRGLRELLEFAKKAAEGRSGTTHHAVPLHETNEQKQPGHQEVLVPFEPLFGFEVSYKSVERLHSDEAGDGTGYHQAMGCSRERESK